MAPPPGTNGSVTLELRPFPPQRGIPLLHPPLPRPCPSLVGREGIAGCRYGRHCRNAHCSERRFNDRRHTSSYD